MNTVRDILAVGAAVVVMFVAAFIVVHDARQPAPVQRSIDLESDAWIAERREERVRTMSPPQETNPPAREARVPEATVRRPGIPIPEPEISLQLPEPQALPLPVAAE